MNPIYIVQEWINEPEPDYTHLIIYKLQEDNTYLCITSIQFNGEKRDKQSGFAFPITYFNKLYHPDWNIHHYNSDSDLLINHPELL